MFVAEKATKMQHKQQKMLSSNSMMQGDIFWHLKRLSISSKSEFFKTWISVIFVKNSRKSYILDFGQNFVQKNIWKHTQGTVMIFFQKKIFWRSSNIKIKIFKRIFFYIMSIILKLKTITCYSKNKKIFYFYFFYNRFKSNMV